MEYDIIDSIWFGHIGIVAIRGWKAYIGHLPPYVARTEDKKDHEQHIAQWGMPVGKAIACAAFPGLDPDLWRH